MLVLKNINKKFNNTTVLKNLNMEIKSGLNFIVGPSGSGKSTLLKIISGMDREFQGEVFYKGNSVKSFDNSELTSYYYNSVGFIWQNFQLIDHLSVEDNIKVVLDLENISNEEKEKKVFDILRRLAIEKLAKKNVSTLSGGQKQRVAIARALVKEPEIIIADEPTGALDKKTSNLIMSALGRIAKERIVIVVTHDRSLVSDDSNCFLLKDGAISQIADGNKEKAISEKQTKVKPSLSLGRATILGIKNFKGMFMKFTLTALILMLSSYFLLLNISGTVVNEQENILNELVEAKGNSLRDINIYSNVMGAGGTGGDSTNKPNLNIEQDVSEVLNKYQDDARIEFFAPMDVVNNMVVNIDGIVKNYTVENSNSTPSINEVIEGRLPKAEGMEVAVSNAFVERAGLKASDVIGKNISIVGGAFDWSSGQPKEVKVKLDNLTIVGVIDTKISYVDPKYGEMEFEFEDSFIYGLDAVRELRVQKKASQENVSFTIRVKEIKDVMVIVDELNKVGITPMGQFESVSDILRINDTTKEQSGAIAVIIAAIAIVVTLAVVLINAMLRRREFAILKINGYSKGSIFNLNIAENLLIAVASIVIFVVVSPAINNMSNKIFNMSVSGSKAMITGIVIILIQGIVMGIISALITSNIKTENNIMTGDR